MFPSRPFARGLPTPHLRRAFFLCVVALTLPASAVLASPAVTGASARRSEARRAVQDPPFVAVRVDEVRNKLLLEIPAGALNQDMLYQNTLATGLGVGGGPGLDRGQLGQSVVVRLERRGARVLLVRDNWSVRALGADAAGQQAAAEGFPRSVVATFPVESEKDGALVVDATSFFLSDTYGIADALRGGQAGTFRVEPTRSWFDTDRTKSFPRNAEVHAVLTFTSDAPGAVVRRAAPDARAMTFELHHSLVVLPDSDTYVPRAHDPRAGYGGTQFGDYSQSFDGIYRGGYINRWRLVPRDTAAYLRGELVEPVTPIVYYLDPAIPAPYREAFREGGNWWNRVFEAAGFRNAFSVQDLPADADPMDARYSMLYWVHRNGPGPSVGPSFSDPRTGQIVRTVVRMDSWRSLIDYNIWAGTVPASGPSGPNVDAETFTMARRKQHTAHEIGHTLGLQHNFIAATQARSSVMDYPVPFITLSETDTPDLRDAYRDGPGAWDTLAIRYGYTWYPNAEAEKAGLAAILQGGIDAGIKFIPDQHAGANGSMPSVTRWVEGADMFSAVERTSRVRRVLMDKFDERAIQPGEPMHLLNMRFAHVYLHHRYSLEGLVKTVGGMDFSYAMRGDKQVPTTILPAADQRRALRMALDALKPAELMVPARIQSMIPPSPSGLGSDFTWIDGAAGTAFDAVSLAGGLATEVLQGLLDPERTARLVVFEAREPGGLTLSEMMDSIVQRTWMAPRDAAPEHRVLERAVQRAALDALLDLAGNRRALPEVRAVAMRQLERISESTTSSSRSDEAQRAHLLAARRDIALFMDGRDDPMARSRFPVIPLPWP